MFENTPYCPLLYTRVAEIKALFQLSSAAKDRMFPIFVARPWPNSKELARIWDKLEEAFGNRRFGLDLDESRAMPNGSRVSEDFSALFDPASGFQNYYNAVSDLQWAIPVLRYQGGEFPQLEGQVAHATDLDRGFIVRITNGKIHNAVDTARHIAQLSSDAVFIIDCGWTRDILQQENWASMLISAISESNPEAEIAVTGSTFPSSFNGMGSRKVEPLQERVLFSNLVRQHNRVSLIYGDWASTRPPSSPSPMRNIPRIDLPESGDWIFFRRDPNSAPLETYEHIAQRAVSDPAWPSDLMIWGTYTILNTANGLPGAIRSPGTAAAARINIHLHRQSFFGSNEVSDGEEPFTD